MDVKGMILVVDDDPVIRRGLQRMLSNRGYSVEVAENVETAQQLWPRKLYDLVITDLQMPGQDGLALLQDIKQHQSHTPVVMLTGHGSMEVVVQALRHGASDFLNKPYQPDELFSIVDREVIKHRQSLPPGAAEGWSLQLTAAQADDIDRLLVNLRVEINARAVLVIEGNGSVIAAKGAIDDLNISALGALVAGDFAATAGIASLIGEEEAFQLNFHEGVQYSIYSGQVVKGIYLLVMFGQDVRLGAVLYYTKDTLAKLKPIIEAAVIPAAPRRAPTTPVVASPAPSPAPSPSEAAVASTSPVAAAPLSPEPAEPEPPALFSFEDIMESGLLDQNLTDLLEQQFNEIWQPS